MQLTLSGIQNMAPGLSNTDVFHTPLHISRCSRTPKRSWWFIPTNISDGSKLLQLFYNLFVTLDGDPYFPAFNSVRKLCYGSYENIRYSKDYGSAETETTNLRDFGVTNPFTPLPLRS